MYIAHREVDWLFSSDAGRLQLAESAGVERLVVVTMHRGHTYSSLEQVKEEVAAKAVELVQSGITSGKQVRGQCVLFTVCIQWVLTYPAPHTCTPPVP